MTKKNFVFIFKQVLQVLRFKMKTTTSTTHKNMQPQGEKILGIIQ